MKLVFNIKYVFLTMTLIPSLISAGSVEGVVKNALSGKPLTEVSVSISKDDIITESDSLGRYYVDSLEPGSYTFYYQKEGFESQKRNDVYVAGAGKKWVDIELVPEILVLDNMVVSSKTFHRSPDMASSTKIMTADEILRAPGALTDVQRVVQNLPSVTSGGDNVNEVVVRGGMPGENLLIMDHIEIPNANHFADQNSGGGVISLINPLLVKGLTFNAGAPPAQYGGKASSVIDVALREGNDVMVLGGVDLGMAGAGGHLEGPLWKGANFMISGHKSYLDFYSNFEPTVAIPQFWGFQGKLSQKIGNHSVQGNGIFGKNHIQIQELQKENMEYDIIESGGIVYAGGASWKAQWNEKISSLLAFSGTGNSYDRLAYNPSVSLNNTTTQPIPADTFFYAASYDDIQTLKVQCALELSNNNRLIFGAHGKRCEFMIDQREKPDTLKNFIDDSINGIVIKNSLGNPTVFQEYAQVHDTTFKYGAFTSLTLRAFDRLRLVPGIRIDGFTYTKDFSVSPRLSALLSINNNCDITAAFGVQHQDPTFVDISIDPENSSLKSKQAITTIAGLEYYFDRWDIKLISEAFYKKYNHLLFKAEYLTIDSLDNTDRLVDNGEGHSFGIELFVQKKLIKSFFWTIAGSLSKSLYRDLRPGHKNTWYNGDYDFGHSFTVTGGWKKELLKSKRYMNKFHDKLWFKILSPIMPIADRMEISMKWRYLGGRPYTEKKFSETYRRWYVDPKQPLNNERYNPYHRLDIRYERRYGFGFLQMIYYIDIQNIYNKENLWTYLYPDRVNKKSEIYQFPFFPAGGIIIGF